MVKKSYKGDLLEGRNRAERVDGRTIYPDYVKPLGYIGGGIVLSLFSLGGCAVVGTRVAVLTGRLLGMAALGLLAVVGGGVVFLGLVLRNRRVVIGDDRMQLIGGSGQVLGQLPYNNILAVQHGVDGGVEITLDSVRRRDTWWPEWADNRRQCDVAIPVSVESDATALRMYLRDAVRAYRHQHGGPPWAHD